MKYNKGSSVCCDVKTAFNEDLKAYIKAQLNAVSQVMFGFR